MLKKLILDLCYKIKFFTSGCKHDFCYITYHENFLHILCAAVVGMIDQSSEEVIINFKWRQQQTPGL
jgi:hypothetical protein